MNLVVIAGGGIAGLATALCLDAAGHPVTVVEKYDFTEIGAGIQLAPNAFHALDQIGVGAAVRESAVFIDELSLRDGVSGEVVQKLLLTDDYRRRFGNPYAVVHRGDLYQALLEECRARPGIELLARRQVVTYVDGPEHVEVVTDDGVRRRAAALVGADGLRSSVRAQLVGDGAPRISGHTIYRTVIPMEQVPEHLRWNTVTLWAGPGRHFVHYPIHRGQFLNLAATRDDGAAVEVAGEPVERAHVLAEFADMSATARELLALGHDWRTWVLCDRDPLDVWNAGRVTLIGDAAHPMLQYAAQGACQALEDAVALGRHLSHLDSLPARLSAFCAERRDRAALAQRTARLLGSRIYHPQGLEATARNAYLAGLSQPELLQLVARLHDVPVAVDRRVSPLAA